MQADSFEVIGGRPLGGELHPQGAKNEALQIISAVLLTDDGRRSFFKLWKSRRDENLTHPFLKEKIQWGLVPYVQALLLARYIRGDSDEYPPFLWK